MPTAGLTVVVVDDHQLFRTGLVHALRELGIEVLAEAGSGPAAVAAVLRTRPAVVLMDLELPGYDGVEATRRILAEDDSVQVLALTVQAGRSTLLDALLAGVAGYLLKDAPMHEVVQAIEAAARGDVPISPRVARGLVDQLHETGQLQPTSRAEIPHLTDRELDVLALLADGCDNAEIAEQLVVSPHTVKTHVSRVLVKLEVSNRVQAAVRAHRDGLLRPGDQQQDSF
jgi:DNA-binding NarL/FixJ family response regulator